MPRRNGVGFEGYLGSANSRIIARNHRYYLEDKPHYLDDPDGEFWFDKKGNGGRLYVMLPGGIDPNTVVLEAGKETTLIHMEEKDHISISGLSFRFTNVSWDLDGIALGHIIFHTKKTSFHACIRVWEGGKDIHVSNCNFHAHECCSLYESCKTGIAYWMRVSVTDCDIRETDHSAITIESGLLWGYDMPDDGGHLFDVKVLRNFIYKCGQRSQRVGSGNAIDIDCAQTLEIAGNIIDTPWHAGINVFGGKRGNHLGRCPACSYADLSEQSDGRNTNR
jgi:hypothetical protein